MKPPMEQLTKPSPHAILTVRQARFLNLCAHFDDKEIADALHVSVSAVRKLSGAVARKFGASRRRDMVWLMAYSRGWLDAVNFATSKKKANRPKLKP